MGKKKEEIKKLRNQLRHEANYVARLQMTTAQLEAKVSSLEIELEAYKEVNERLYSVLSNISDMDKKYGGGRGHHWFRVALRDVLAKAGT